LLRRSGRYLRFDLQRDLHVRAYEPDKVSYDLVRNAPSAPHAIESRTTLPWKRFGATARSPIAMTATSLKGATGIA